MTRVREVLEGQRLGAYLIERRIGAGGMGEVFRALDTRLNRPVAIKLLSSELADSSARRRFQQEAKMASALNHPHILTVHEAAEFDGRQYLVTEFVEAVAATRLQRSSRASPGRALAVVPLSSVGRWPATCALTAFGAHPSAGTYIYDFETRQARKVPALGPSRSVARWLSDSRRLLAGYEGRLYLVNPADGTSREVLAVLPDVISTYPLSRDDRLIVYSVRSNRADIWLASAEHRPAERP